MSGSFKGKGDCPHDELQFGSGGFYIFCFKCSAAWVAIENQDADIDYSRVAVTLHPRYEGKFGTFKWEEKD